jgi:hypothetical protein
MSNMSYCRFQNTRGDLRDCQSALEDLFAGEEALSAEELEAAKSLAQRCLDIVQLLSEEAGLDFDAHPLERKLGALLDSANRRLAHRRCPVCGKAGVQHPMATLFGVRARWHLRCFKRAQAAGTFDAKPPRKSAT